MCFRALVARLWSRYAPAEPHPSIIHRNPHPTLRQVRTRCFHMKICSADALPSSFQNAAWHIRCFYCMGVDVRECPWRVRGEGLICPDVHSNSFSVYLLYTPPISVNDKPPVLYRNTSCILVRARKRAFVCVQVKAACCEDTYAYAVRLHVCCRFSSFCFHVQRCL